MELEPRKKFYNKNAPRKLKKRKPMSLKRKKLLWLKKLRSRKKKPHQTRSHNFTPLTDAIVAQAKREIVAGAACIQVGGWAYLRSQNNFGCVDDATPEITDAMVHRFKIKNAEWLEAEILRFPQELAIPPRVFKVNSIAGENPFKRSKPMRFYRLNASVPARPLLLDEAFGFGNFLKGQTRTLFFDCNIGVTRKLVSIAQDAQQKNENLQIIYVLVKARPEEPAELSQLLPPSVEVYASYIDSPIQMIAEIPDFALARAQRLAELGKDALIIVDGLTNWANALNSIKISQSGKTQEGEVNLFVRIIEKVRQYLQASYQLEGKGSISIVAGVRRKSEPSAVDKELASLVTLITSNK